MLASDQRNSAWYRNNENTESLDTSAPLFEREHRQESAYVSRLQDELADTKSVLDGQARRQADLEYVNEDLERRLEAEAKEKIHLKSLREEDGRQLQLERKRQEDEKAVWMKKVKDEIRH